MRKMQRFVLLTLLFLVIEAVYSQQETFDINPNPFSTTTNLDFSLIQDGKITINVYNISGQKVGTNIQDSFFTSGPHTIVFNADTLKDGIYIMHLVVGATKLARKAVKITSSSNINKVDYKNDVLVFPNPTNGNIKIKINRIQGKPLKVDIYDNTGREVFTENYSQNNIEINMMDFESGIYTIRIPDLNYNYKLILIK